MTPDELELVPTQSLINELVRRTTFLGVIVQASEEYRTPWTEGDRSFRVHYNDNLDDGEALRLLSVVSEQMLGFDA
jgi:hypothetical protein